jgi:hypothetical protein
MPSLRSPLLARPRGTRAHRVLWLPLVLAAVACGGVDNDDRAASASGGGGPGSGGAGATGGGGTGAAGGTGGGGPGICGAPEGAHARADVTLTGTVSGACQVPSVEATAEGTRAVVVCEFGNATIDVTADPPLAVALSSGQFVDVDLDTENIEGPEYWGALRSPDDGSLLLGFVSAGSPQYFEGDPWYAPLTMEQTPCGDDTPRIAWKLGYERASTLVTEEQRRTLGAASEYVVQTSALHGISTGVATTPTDTHVMVIARQP